jgi:energy-coupling factor transporter ATP-binding protein EcfA2
MNDRTTYFAETDFRGERTSFGIKNEDRSRHVYVIGKTGMGKSTLLENMAAQDIQNGEGMCFLDPHGSAIDTLLEYIPEHRVKDVVYFAPFDSDFPIAFNVMEDVGVDQRHLVVSGLMSAFKKIWVDAWSARMEHILNNTILALLEYPGSTLLGVNRMYADKGYREEVVRNVKDPAVRSFWNEEFAKWDERFMREATAAIQNKIGQFTANPLIRNIVGQSVSSFDFRKAMDTQKIVLVNLSKGRVGEQNAALLGAMIVTKIYLAAMSRAEVSKNDMATLPPFFLFVDEFQIFANDSFADILAEARKYKLNLTIAHQYIEQMEENVRDAVFGNVGTTISFRVGPLDAEVLEKIFLPTFTAEDIVNLGKYQIYLTLMIDGVGSKPFSATNMPPLKRKPITYRDEVIEFSRATYANPRKEVQAQTEEWHAHVFETVKDKKEREKKEVYLAEKARKEKIIYGDKPAPTEPSKIKIPTEIIEQVKNAESKPAPKKENFAQRPNLSTVKNGTEKNKSLLKDVLSKALQNSPQKSTPVAPIPPKPSVPSTASQGASFEIPKPSTPPPVQEQKIPESKKETPPPQNAYNFSEKKREIPEDVLKQILE